MLGITDEPIKSFEQDTLNLEHYVAALLEFIKTTDTPMTIGVQGQWGSGKTSMLNSIKKHLDSENEYRQIWINSWELSILCSPEETLIKVIEEIVDELVKDLPDDAFKAKIKSTASSFIKGAVRIGAVAALGKKAGDVAEEFLNNEEKVKGVKELRSQLSDLVANVEKSSQNKFSRVIIYIDDLDRIEPKNAVQILELLKNIFNIEHCVFVLAIDYQVVVKGLEHKFGKQTPENEYEFKAYFDKIIQLPFMMPLGKYNLVKYVKNLLERIKFFDSEINEEQFNLDIYIKNTIGNNPRSIKRLMNSAVIINLLHKSKNSGIKEENIANKDDIKRNPKLIFALLCMQVAYPDITELMSNRFDFWDWDKSFVKDINNKIVFKDKEELDAKYKMLEDEKKAYKTNENSKDLLNETWEEAVFEICFFKPTYRRKALEILTVMNQVKSDFIKGEDDYDTLYSGLDEVSITSVSTKIDSAQGDKPKPRDFSNELKKQIAEEYLYGEEMLSIHKLGQKHNIERNVSRLYIKKWCDEFFGKEEYEKRAAKTRRTPRGG